MKSFKLFIYVLLVIVSFFYKTNAQNCSTPDVSDIPNYIPNYVRNNSQVSYVAINLVIVKDLSNNYPTNNLNIDAEIEYANERYFAAGLQFYLCKITEIKSNLYNFSRFPETNFNLLLNSLDSIGNKSSKLNQINVYHVNSIVQGNLAVARFPWDLYNNIIVTYGTDTYSPSTLSHELGHYFGLLHTHNGSNIGTIYMPLVSQPKTTFIGTTRIGDGIEDTPSDPSSCTVGFECNVVHCDAAKFDSAHVAYDTIVNNDNIMSYRCQNTFTTTQLNIISQYAEGARSQVVSPQYPPECIDYTIGNVHKVCGDDIIGFFEVPIRNAKINISKKPSGSSCYKRTDSGGNYNIRNCVDFGTNDTILNAPSKFISGEKLYEYTNGVTTADLVAMNRHILLIETLLNPYHWLAADVNYDGKISTADMVKTRKIVLRVDNEFENTNSWRFVPEWYQQQPSFSSTFNDVLNGNTSGPFKAVWTSPSNTGLSYSTPASPENTYLDHFNVLANMQNIQSDTVWSFTAVKTGDVNCTSKVDYSSFTVDDENLTLNVAPHLCIPAGDTATFDLIATANSNMVAYQTQLDFNLPENPLALPGDGSPFEVFNISAGQLINTPTEYYNLVSNNYRKHLKVSWMSDSLTQTNLSNGVSILQFSIKANQTICNIGSIVSNTAKELNSQLYSPSGQLMNNTYLQLVRNDIQSRSKNNNDPKDIDFSVYPNPYLDELNFAISNEIEQPIELILYNSTGQMVQSIKKQGAKGINVITIDTKDVKDNVLIYHLKVGNKTYRDKVIKLDK